LVAFSTRIFRLARSRCSHQVMRRANCPRAEEILVVHDLVELRGQLASDRGDRPVEGAGQVLVEGHGAGERLLDQRLDQFLGRSGSVCLVAATTWSSRLTPSVVYRRRPGRTGISDMDSPPACQPELAGQRFQSSSFFSTCSSRFSSFRTVTLLIRCAACCVFPSGAFQGRHLFGDLRRIEIAHRASAEVDRHLGAVVGQLCVDLHPHARRHPAHHVVNFRGRSG